MTRIIDNASASDARVLALDPCPWSERFLTSEKNNVIFDWFAGWRTGDEGLFILRPPASLIAMNWSYRPTP
ncbi:hypothetical protein [Methylomonas sp. DH-1]|uniref:hypothetical protein n=1 Tax=Methylomonas sp. (strain DH-1) TaxID=1727196 RepID=UPI0012F6BA21|nr:hypothetical protein [Methylomonas sp. DH-1]